MNSKIQKTFFEYTATYSAMNCFEEKAGVFRKTYPNGTRLEIRTESNEVFINGEFAFLLCENATFVKLECVHRILSLGYLPEDFSVEPFRFHHFVVRFFAWQDAFPLEELAEGEIFYKARLTSGILEYQTKIKKDGDIFDYGVFEKKWSETELPPLKKKSPPLCELPGFEIEENRLVRYFGSEKIVRVPEGIHELCSTAFWDNQTIEEVILPDSLVQMGGDTFYNCTNLVRLMIPKSVASMGNNPFASCPKLVLKNESPHFLLKNGVLYTADKKTVLYCAIDGSGLKNESELEIPEGVECIGKHAFFRCERLKKITLPSSLKKMENNPFSGCPQLFLINHSVAYIVKDDVIYNGFMTSVIGTLNKITADCLVIPEGVKTINRNSFWNCTGIKKIVLPSTLTDIGYNPFVGCANIHFESKSPFFSVCDGILYDTHAGEKSKIICCPAWKAVGKVHIPDSVLALERGAFSGCNKMTEINLHNVSAISKNCFTNCTSLVSLHVSDLVTSIGAWAFAYCKNLRDVSVKKGTKIAPDAFSNCPARLTERNHPENYVIESDNLFTLRSLLANCKGVFDAVLIDPPYNSNISYIGYKDSGYAEGYTEFLRQRFSITKELLSENGWLVVNIDEGEWRTIFDLCAELFGSENVSVKKWKKKHPFFDKNRVVLNPNKMQTDFEYIIFAKKNKSAMLKKIMQPYLLQDSTGKEILSEKETDVPDIFDCFGTTSSAKDEIERLFGRRDYFSTPKPVKLMKELVRATTGKNSRVLDFFAGSGTTGHAVTELNREDGGSRTFMLVSNSESDICKTVTMKRMEKIGAEFVVLE